MQFGYKDLPLEILNQINNVVDIWKRYLGDDLIGVYLHGSIALKAFSPDLGDIDILVVHTTNNNFRKINLHITQYMLYSRTLVKKV